MFIQGPDHAAELALLEISRWQRDAAERSEEHVGEGFGMVPGGSIDGASALGNIGGSCEVDGNLRADAEPRHVCVVEAVGR